MSKKLTLKDFAIMTSERTHCVISMNNYKNIHSKITFFCYVCESILKQQHIHIETQKEQVVQNVKNL
jgi:hypothetical protein